LGTTLVPVEPAAGKVGTGRMRNHKIGPPSGPALIFGRQEPPHITDHMPVRGHVARLKIARPCVMPTATERFAYHAAELTGDEDSHAAACALARLKLFAPESV